MSRINKIIKSLKAKNVSEYRIIETIEDDYQQFYDLQKLETVRRVSTTEEQVTIYVKTAEDGKTLMGEASFIVSHEESKANLEKLIDQAIYEASFIKNQEYSLVNGDKKKSMAYKPLAEDPFTILTKLAKIFFKESNEVARFNALELFFNDVTTHIVNSNGVDYKKRTYEINIEAIPSFYGEGIKTELYRMFEYNELNYDKAASDAKEAILDVYNRGKAVKLEGVNKANIILRDKDLFQLAFEVIDSLHYASVYNHSNLKKVGEALTSNKINIGLDANTKYDYFDNDGVRLSKCSVIEDGIVKSYYGNNRYACYIGEKPTGNLNKLTLSKGKKSVEAFKTKPYLEIYDMSGIQVDAYQNYLGGEVRLALYFDGKDIIPVSGFSFSANLQEAIDNMSLSKEVSNINNYSGAKFALIKDVAIN
ncbi:MAG: hypothetical protein J6X93_06085 [Bacilli bacterium]|nr:hypothetical protein [Bacilli bacterium]